MEILTTPDDAADGLPDSDVDRHYMTIPDDDNRVLRPIGVPIEVTRRLEGDQLIWSYLGTTVTLERIGGPDSPPPTA